MMRAKFLGVTAVFAISAVVSPAYAQTNFVQTGFLYDNGSYELIAPPGSTNATATGINNAGQIIGYNGGVGGYLYSGGSYTTIAPPGSFSQANAINDSGQIVGIMGNSTGFLYSGGGFTTISVPGSTYTDALAVNGVGQVAGIYNPDHTVSRDSFTVPGATLLSRFQGPAIRSSTASMPRVKLLVPRLSLGAGRASSTAAVATRPSNMWQPTQPIRSPYP
jgi:hypothetical protein